MNTSLFVSVQWIKERYGGRSEPPFCGMRPGIRFQKAISLDQKSRRDVKVFIDEFDSNTWRGEAHLIFARAPAELKDFLVEGALFELLDGIRVIGVGRVDSVDEGN